MAILKLLTQKGNNATITLKYSPANFKVRKGIKKMSKKMKIALLIIATVVVCCAVFNKPAINYLIGQSANPTGFIGNLMTRIWSVSFRNQNQWAHSLLDGNDEDMILIVGFGSGSGIKYMKDQGDRNIIFGVDISDEAVKTATALNQKHIDANEVILSVGDVASLEFDEAFFDLVVAGQTHIYWSELQKGLMECHRVLVVGGTLLITCEIDKIEYHLPEYRNPDIFSDLLYSIGFTDIDVRSNNNYISFICTK
jgi:SAM-dependent methyltransferase